jgi:hypothetical protein
MIFTQDQISFIKQLITNRNKEVRHEVSDHLDNTLPYKKIAGLGGAIPADGSVITSDTSQVGGAKWLKPPQGRMYLSSAQNINNSGAWQKLTAGWTNDTNVTSGVTADTANSNLVCLTAGLYRVKIHGAWVTTTSALQWGFLCSLNNTTEQFSVTGYHAGGWTTDLSPQNGDSRLVRLAVNDTISIYALWGWAGGATTYQVLSGSENTYIEIEYVGV